MKKENEGPCKFAPKPELDGNLLTSRQIIKQNEATFDRKAALEESRKILALINSPELKSRSDRPLLGQIAMSNCHHCNCGISLNENSKCKFCHQEFCLNHRAEFNHKCEKINEQTASYLNAKNQFKLRLKEAKNKIKC